MANTLKSQLVFTSVPAGGTAALPHGLQLNGAPRQPDHIEFENADFDYVSSSATTVTVINNGTSAATCRVLCELWHTFERVFADGEENLASKPFVDRGVGGSGGGGTADTAAIAGLALIYQPGGGQAGPVVYDTWAALMAQLAVLRTASNNDGLYTIQFDDSFTSPAVVPAGAYDMSDVTWRGDDLGFGVFVDIAPGATFTRLRNFQYNLNITNNNTTGVACSDLIDGDIVTIENCTIDGINTAQPFYRMTGAGTVIVNLLGQASIGLSGAGTGRIFDVTTTGSLFIFSEGLVNVGTAALQGAAGATLQIAINSLESYPTTLSGWSGTITEPRLDIPPSLRPTPFLDAVLLTAPTAATFSRWLRFNAAGASGAAVTQTLPDISTATGSLRAPGCFVLISEESPGTDGGRVIVQPAAGDTINGSTTSYIIPPQSSVLFISDGIDNWRAVAQWDVQRYALPDQWEIDNLPAAFSGAASAQGSTFFDQVAAVRAGSVVGISVQLTDALTGGTVTLSPTVNGAAIVGAEVVVDNSTFPTARATFPIAQVRYNAGDLLGVLVNAVGVAPVDTISVGVWLQVVDVPLNWFTPV